MGDRDVPYSMCLRNGQTSGYYGIGMHYKCLAQEAAEDLEDGLTTHAAEHAVVGHSEHGEKCDQTSRRGTARGKRRRVCAQLSCPISGVETAPQQLLPRNASSLARSLKRQRSTSLQNPMPGPTVAEAVTSTTTSVSLGPRATLTRGPVRYHLLNTANILGMEDSLLETATAPTRLPVRWIGMCHIRCACAMVRPVGTMALACIINASPKRRRKT